MPPPQGARVSSARAEALRQLGRRTATNCLDGKSANDGAAGICRSKCKVVAVSRGNGRWRRRRYDGLNLRTKCHIFQRPFHDPALLPRETAASGSGTSPVSTRSARANRPRSTPTAASKSADPYNRFWRRYRRLHPATGADAAGDCSLGRPGKSFLVTRHSCAEAAREQRKPDWNPRRHRRQG